MRRYLWTPALLLLAACGATPEEKAKLDALDDRLVQADEAPAADPVLQSALKDQIMVDPALVQQANADTVRPPMQPESGMVPPAPPAGTIAAAKGETLRSAPPASGTCPQCAAAKRALTLGALAQSQGAAGKCVANVAYSTMWANRLPRGVPLYPDAQVAEAAGADGDGCALRVVSFASAAPMQRLLDWYYTRATDAGYRAQHGADGAEHVLGGTRAGGAAFLLVLNPRKGGGTDVDLMADGGA